MKATVLRTLVFVTLLALVLGAHACTLSTQPLAFGSINPIAGISYTTSSSVTVTCPTLTDFTVWISAGNGTVDQRVMTSGAYSLKYNVYIDPGMTTVWGDGTSGMGWLGSADSLGTIATVYGLLPYQPTAYPGVYADSLTVIVSF